jgi:hypothetical protein
VDELIESYFDPLSNDGLIDILEAKDYDCWCLLRLLTINEMKEAFDHLRQSLSIMDECDLNAERSLQVGRAVYRETAFYRCLY